MEVPIVGQKKFKFCPMLTNVIGMDEVGQPVIIKIGCVESECIIFDEVDKLCTLDPSRLI